MIRPLRRAHRLVAAALVITVPALLACLLTFRPAAPATAEAHAGTIPSGFSIDIALDRASSPIAQIAASDRGLPEVLVYWSEPGAKVVGTHSILLGTLTTPGQRFQLPPGQTDGSVLLYSPPLDKILERLEVRKGVGQ